MAPRLHLNDTVSERSPLNRPSDRIDELAAQLERGFSFTPNPAYESYLKMHKVWVGQKGADYLRGIYESLSQEQLPRYLSAAGWAAVETAIVQTDNPTQERLDLLKEGVSCWERALEMYLAINKIEGKTFLYEKSAPYRVAFDMAATPYLEGLVLGHVTEGMCRDAFMDSLEVAQANAHQMRLAKKAGDHEAYGDHSGFAHECNALLALNRMQSKNWFSLPTIARADSGHYYPKETHDLLVVRRREGEIQSVVPLEIKTKANMRDRKRYMALIVLGNAHLCADRQPDPIRTLEAIAASEHHIATPEQASLAKQVSLTMMEMIEDYYCGQEIGTIATTSLTKFHDRSYVVTRRPELATTRS